MLISFYIGYWRNTHSLKWDCGQNTNPTVLKGIVTKPISI